MESVWTQSSRYEYLELGGFQRHSTATPNMQVRVYNTVYVYVYVYVCVYIYIYIYVSKRIFMCVYIHVYTIMIYMELGGKVVALADTALQLPRICVYVDTFLSIDLCVYMYMYTLF